MQEAAKAARINQDERKAQQDVFDQLMAEVVSAASDQQTSFDDQMAKATLAASDLQTSFDRQLAKAVSAATDQQTNFDSQMAKAVSAASDQKTSFDSQMAEATLAASDQQRNFDHHMAKAALHASDLKGAYDRLEARSNFQRNQGSRSFVDLGAVALEVLPAHSSSDEVPLDSSGPLQGSAPLQGSSDSAPRRSPSSSLSDLRQSNSALHHSKLSNRHACVTIFFSDLIGFSTWAHELPPETIMATLNDLYTRLDDIILEEMPGVYKVRLGQDSWGKCGPVVYWLT